MPNGFRLDFKQHGEHKQRRLAMPELQRLGVGGVIFLIGAIIYVVNLLLGLARRGRPLPFDGVGLMVLGIGIAMFLKW